MTNVRIGGAPISPRRLHEAVAFFGPVVGQGYELGETTSVVAGPSGDEIARAVREDPELLRSCGRALYDTEPHVVGAADRELGPREVGEVGEVGEVIVRGPDRVREFWREPELSAETFRDGWVHTGDLGWPREDGYLFLVDRKKDMIISGGSSIYRTEVEAALYEHPAAREACVVGVPDERSGEAVKAVVVPHPGGAAVAAAELAWAPSRGRSARAGACWPTACSATWAALRSGDILRHATPHQLERYQMPLLRGDRAAASPSRRPTPAPTCAPCTPSRCRTGTTTASRGTRCSPPPARSPSRPAGRRARALGAPGHPHPLTVARIRDKTPPSRQCLGKVK
ncbi:AMP-binding protein [Streptomyces sp. NPDC059459]|uniref:AMP-binding enzyme n=1 Tax=Streptomyces sp. NPDC059459 TaxID=3346839 RepID=UPI0036753C05